MNISIAAKMSALNKERRELIDHWFYRFSISRHQRVKDIDFELQHLKVQELFQKPVQHLSVGEELQMTYSGLAIIKIEPPLSTYQVLMVINRGLPLSWIVKSEDEKQAKDKALQIMKIHIGRNTFDGENHIEVRHVEEI